MAKAQEIAGLECDADVFDWIREIFRVRLTEIFELRDAVLQAENVEAIHDMRVAIRRLRTALSGFENFLKPKPARKLRRDLKQLADVLGVVRDADVPIIALEKLKQKLGDSADKKSLEKLIAQRIQLRGEMQNRLPENFDAARFENLREDGEKLLAKIDAPKKAKKIVSFNEAGSETVGQNLAEFRRLSKNIYQPLDEKSLHKLRIAAKHLRYAIELYTACWGKKITVYETAIAELQSFLGEVHDADVWLADLSVQLVKEYDSANVKLLSIFTKKRTKNYRRALKIWNEWNEKNLLGDLQKIVSQNGV